MLEVEELDNPSFLELVEKAKEDIQDIYPLWTNYNPADSGIVLLELFAYVTELQQFHLQQMGPSHYMMLLHLLGLCPEGLKSARVYARAEGVYHAFLLSKGTKAYADTLILEAEHPIYLEKDNIIKEEKQRPFYPFGENPVSGAYYDIRLRYGLEKQNIHTLYFHLYDNYAVPRNIIDKEQFIPLVELSLSCYDGREYVECEIVEDTTVGLLQTGVISFRLKERMGQWNGEYRLRLTVQGEYDTAPLLQGVCFNMVPLIQRDTKVECREFLLPKEKKEFYQVDVDYWLAVQENTDVYIRTALGYRKTTEFSSYVYDRKRHFVFDSALFDRIAGDVGICLVSCLTNLNKDEYVYYGNGMPDQSFFLPDRNVLGEMFSVWIESTEGSDCYVRWNRVLDFARADKEDRVYVIDEKDGVLRFGNGRQGIMPKGRIEIISYAVCAGKNGNIQRNQISGFVEERGAAKLYNPFPALGGEEAESVYDCVQRYKEHTSIKKRAVTQKDYEEVIRNTPGLRIKKVKVFPSPLKENMLEAVVLPFTNGKRILKGDAYNRNIIHLLEKRKMLGTGIIVRDPEYIGIFIQLEILVQSRYMQAHKSIEAHIRNYFEEQIDFGKTIVYSGVFGYIDALPETAGIHSLEINARGRGVLRDDNRDIHLPFYGIANLEEVNIRCMLTDR
ncbi:MAG: baseplate J/gp47 family protein [Lachnospiraceae bacterium]|nr:baseplate J/gp47 family protein [Lachnospiraceae bacterium]